MSHARTVTALCEALLRERCRPPPAELERRLPEIARFVVAQQGRMPDYLRLPFRLATGFFGLFGVLVGGRPFHRLGPAARWRQIELWRRAPFPPARDLVRFYESLAVYDWYDAHDG